MGAESKDAGIVPGIVRFLFWLAGFLFCFFTITGRDLAETGNILWTGQYTIKILSGSLFLGVGLSEILYRVFRRHIRRGENTFAQKEDVIKKVLSRRRTWQIWLLSGILIMLAWLPCYLAFYPGICSYDTSTQMRQIGAHAYTDHHPIAYTLLLELGVLFGKNVSGSVNQGIALFVLAQMTALAFAMAFGVAVLRRTIRGGWLLFLQLLCMFYPFHKYMSVSVTKDILFAVFFLIQMISLYELIGKCRRESRLYGVLFFVCSVGMQLFRNNGRYAMLFLLGAFVLACLADKKSRKLWRKLAAYCLTALIVGSLLLTMLLRVTKAGEGNKREMLSVPIQQLARCMIYHGGAGVMEADDNSMEEADKALIGDFLQDEGYKLYDPVICDPVKNTAYTYVVRFRTSDFLKTYFRLLRKYPGDFINAVLALDAGYLYLGDKSHMAVYGEIPGFGYVQTIWNVDVLKKYGIFQDSKWESLHKRFLEWTDGNAYYHIPVLKYFMIPASLFWGYILLSLYLLQKGCYGSCVPISLVFGYYFTLLLGPVVQLRYLYPLMAAFPFICLRAPTMEGTAESVTCQKLTGGAGKKEKAAKELDCKVS